MLRVSKESSFNWHANRKEIKLLNCKGLEMRILMCETTFQVKQAHLVAIKHLSWERQTITH